MSEQRFCIECGNPLKSDDKFCMECGKKIVNGNNIVDSNQINNQSAQEHLIFGSNNDTTTEHYEQTFTQKPQKQNQIAIASIIVSIAAFLMFLGDANVLIWISLGIGILGIIVGIISIPIAKKDPELQNKASLGIVGIILNIVVIAVVLSIYFDMF